MESGQKMISPLIIIGVLVVIGVIGAIVMMTRGPSTTETSVDNSEMVTSDFATDTDQLTPTEETESGEAQLFNIEAGSFYFKPNEIRVKKGDMVKITLNSVDMMHDFVIDELGVKIPVTPNGTSSTIEFVASEAGEFEYYCSVGNHKQMGQVGTLIVEE